MDKGTDPRLLMLIYAALNYLDAKKTPVNPFVKGFGVSKAVEEAEGFLKICTDDCSDYFPEVKATLDALQVISSEMDENTNPEESQTTN